MQKKKAAGIGILLIVFLITMGCTTSPGREDSDNDGIIDSLDRFPDDPDEWEDTDSDGIGDNSDADIDGDGWNNTIEIELDTDPSDNLSVPGDIDLDHIPDTIDEDIDGDGLSNEYEMALNSRIEEMNNRVVFRYNESRRSYDDCHYDFFMDIYDPSDAALDFDLEPIRTYSHVPLGGDREVGSAFVGKLELRPDGLTNLEEMENGTDPLMWDTDGDSFERPDGSELAFDDGWEVNSDEDTIPTNPDSDGDGAWDGWEVYYGHDPLNASDRFIDTDGDGLFPFEEYDNGTDPLDPDTDDDGMKDGWELRMNLLPTEPDAYDDPDDDGLINLDEYRKGTDPHDRDTDGDGSGDEGDAFPKNPTVWSDVNGDGIGDNYETIIEEMVGGVPFHYIVISPGTFMMGSPDDEGYSNERPRHEVTITGAFEMLRFEVNRTQWEAVTGSDPGHFSGVDNPVETVSWNDCQSFISELNQLDTNHTYRLPTEAEWEYCCRAGTDTPHCNGSDEGHLAEHAWYSGNSGGGPHPGGQKRPNVWGLHDMHGNVWEWCQDRYDSEYYGKSPATDPQGPTSGSLRVLRGGYWGHEADGCRSAYRTCNGPDFLDNTIGLRILRSQS